MHSRRRERLRERGELCAHTVEVVIAVSEVRVFGTSARTSFSRLSVGDRKYRRMQP